jgi:hypothetical protein
VIGDVDAGEDPTAKADSNAQRTPIASTMFSLCLRTIKPHLVESRNPRDGIRVGRR